MSLASITDTTLQQKVMDPIRFDWAGDLIERNELNSAAEVIQAIGNLEPRVELLAKLADAQHHKQAIHLSA